MSSNIFLQAALNYAQRGYAVHPLYGVNEKGECDCRKPKCASPGKHPRLIDGVHGASKDPEQLQEWWATWPNANVGIATGSITGFDVLDRDGEIGRQSLLALEQEHGALPPTVTVNTGSGNGDHYLFQTVGLRNTSSVLRPGLDTRGPGGYIVAPPSKHYLGGTYQFASGKGLDDVGIAPTPQWLVQWNESSKRDKPQATFEGKATWTPPASTKDDTISVPEAWKRLFTPGKKYTEVFLRARRGEPLHPPGEHYNPIYADFKYARHRLPELSDETILFMFEPAIEAMECPKHDMIWAAEILEKITQEAIVYKSEEDLQRKEIDAAFALHKGAESSSRPEDHVWLTTPSYDNVSSGIFRHSGDENKKPSRVAAAPMEVAEIGQDEEGNLYRTLRYQYGNKILEETVPRGASLLGLAAKGAPIHRSNEGKLEEFLNILENHCYNMIPKGRIQTQPGYSPDMKSYVVGGHVLGGDPARVLTANVDPRFHAAIHPKGDLKSYCEFFTTIRGRTPTAEMMLSVPFGAPLLRLLDQRTFVVSGWSNSGGGKTAATVAALSTFGKPAPQIISANTSQAALTLNAAQRNDYTFAIDDTQQGRENVMETLVYDVANERSSSRATVTGGLRADKAWRQIAIVTGEKPLFAGTTHAGAKNRALEVHGSPIGDVNLAREAHRFFASNYGIIGPKYIQELFKRYIANDNIHELRDLYGSLVRQLNSEPTERTHQVGVLVTGDFLARTWLFDEAVESAREASLKAGATFLGLVATGDSEVTTVGESAYEAIVSFTVQHKSSFLDATSSTAPALADFSNQQDSYQCFGQFETFEGKPAVSILKSVFGEIAEKNKFSERQAVKLLREKKLLGIDSSDRATRRVKIAGQRAPVYTILLPSDQNQLL